MLAQNVLKKFDPKPSETVFSTVFLDNLRPEVDSYVISRVAVE